MYSSLAEPNTFEHKNDRTTFEGLHYSSTEIVHPGFSPRFHD